MAPGQRRRRPARRRRARPRRGPLPALEARAGEVRAVCICSSTGQANRALGVGSGTTRMWTALAPAPGRRRRRRTWRAARAPSGARGAGRRRTDFVRFRDGGDDAEAHARELDLNRARGGKRGNDVAVRENVAPVPKERPAGPASSRDARRAASASADEARPTWAGETPARNLGASRAVERSNAPERSTDAEDALKENDGDGAFAAWMVRARRGHTRTPAAFRGTTRRTKCAAAAEPGVGACRNLEGDAVFENAEHDQGFASGGSMAAMRSAIAAASRASADRRESARRHLGSHVGIA